MSDVDYTQLFTLLRHTPDAAVCMPEGMSPDWPRLFQQAAEQEILPVLYGQARALPPSALPPAEIMQRLRAVYLHGASRNIRLFHGLAQVLTALREAGIPVIVLKGAHLAALVYRDPAYRLMGDVDLLIHYEHLDDVRPIMHRLGAQQNGISSKNGTEVHHEKYILPVMRAGIEMHWSLERHDGRVSALCTADLWTRAHTVTIEEAETQVLAPDDLYVYLCQHIYFHGFRVHLRHIFDLAECIRTFQYDAGDWKRIRQRAVEWRMERAVAILTHLVREWWCPHIPVDAFDPALIPAGERGTALIAYAGQAVMQGATHDDLPNHLARFLGHRSLREKWDMLRDKLFPVRDVMAQRYHCSPSSPRLYALYPVHLLHLFGKYGLRLFRRSRHPRSLTVDLANQAAFLDWMEGIDQAEVPEAMK